MFTMYDSVNLDEIPAEPHAVAAYINGQYANVDAAKQKFPHARILSIAVQGDTVADCYDVEHGDYKPSEAGALFDFARKAGVWRPCFYANLSTMPAVKESLNHVDGIKRSDIRLWVAAWDGITQVPAGYDAHQFETNALGRNLDESICDSTFFQAAALASPSLPDEPKDYTVDLTVTRNGKTGAWEVTQK